MAVGQKAPMARGVSTKSRGARLDRSPPSIIAFKQKSIPCFFEKWRQFWFWKDLPPSFSHLRAAILFFFFVVVVEWKIAARDAHSSPIVVEQVVSLIKVRCDARATIYPIQIAIKFMLELCWHSSVIIYNCSLFIVMTTQYIRECLPETDTST